MGRVTFARPLLRLSPRIEIQSGSTLARRAYDAGELGRFDALGVVLRADPSRHERDFTDLKD